MCLQLSPQPDVVYHVQLLHPHHYFGQLVERFVQNLKSPQPPLVHESFLLCLHLSPQPHVVHQIALVCLPQPPLLFELNVVHHHLFPPQPHLLFQVNVVDHHLCPPQPQLLFHLHLFL